MNVQRMGERVEALEEIRHHRGQADERLGHSVDDAVLHDGAVAGSTGPTIYQRWPHGLEQLRRFMCLQGRPDIGQRLRAAGLKNSDSDSSHAKLTSRKVVTIHVLRSLSVCEHRK